MSIKVIGLCGGSGSGKGAVGLIFLHNGYLVLDTDKIYRDMTDNPSKCLAALQSEFGRAIITNSGALDRKKLAGIVFSDKSKLNKLNEISHKFILDEVRENIKSAEKKGYAGVIVDAPLLYESGFNSECDAVVAVIADTEKRLERIMKRDGISKEEAERRVNSQIPDEQLEQKADFIVVNNGGIEDLGEKILEIISKLN